MRQEREYCVYIITNFHRTTFYIGVTNNLYRRMVEHQTGAFPGFSKKYKLKYLVYVEMTPYIYNALDREKQLKNWHHDWKLNLIRSVNPGLKDLSEEWNNINNNRCRNKFGMT